MLPPVDTILTETPIPTPEPTRRSARTWRPTEAAQQMFEQRDLAFAVAFEAIAEIGAWEFEFNMLNPLAFASQP